MLPDDRVHKFCNRSVMKSVVVLRILAQCVVGSMMPVQIIIIKEMANFFL